jgi:hypothetical protein
MSSSNLSRRAILAGASAVPIIALAPAADAFPSAADIATASLAIEDPILAAIEAHRVANAEYRSASDAFYILDEKRPHREARILIGEYNDGTGAGKTDEHGNRTWTWTLNDKKIPIYASTRDDIEKSVPRDLEGSARETWIEERFAELEKEQKRFAKARARTKTGKLEAISDKSYAVERDRMWDLIWTVPTTLDGLSALLRYSRENGAINALVHDDYGWGRVFERTIECAVCALAGLPEPPMSDVVASVWNENEADAIEGMTA